MHLLFLLSAQDVAVKFQQEPLLVPASTVWKTIFGILGSMSLVVWRLGKFVWAKHKEDIQTIRTDITTVNKAIRMEIMDMDREIRIQFDEYKDVQDAIMKTTVKIADYQENRKEIRDSIHDLHVKVDVHHQEQMKALIALIKGKYVSSD